MGWIWGAAGLGLMLLQLGSGSSAEGATALQLVSRADPAPGASRTGGGDSYLPVLSPDGRFVLFTSTANNLVQLGTNGPGPALFPAPMNVFLRDRTNGSTVLVSMSSDGTGSGNADSLPIGISTNGRYALFESSASNLVPGDTNNAADVFLRDVLSGTTLLVSAGTNGGFADQASYSSSMTPNGGYVAFVSAADNLVPGDTNGIPDVFVRDTVSQVTTLVSVGARNRVGTYPNTPNITSDAPELTPDGRYVAFYSSAANLVPGVTTLGNIFVRDLVSGTTTCASSGALPALQSVVQATNAVSFSPEVSADGHYIAFETTIYPQSLTTATLVLRWSLQSGFTDLIETNAFLIPGASYENAQNLAMTPDGRFVAYVSNATNSTTNTTAVRVWDAQSGASVLISGNLTNGVLAGSLSDSAFLDEAGRFVAFISTAPDLVTNGLQGDFHLYRRDLETGSTILVNVETNGMGSLLDPATTPAMSGDGSLLGFDSLDASLVPLDHNRAYDVFLGDPAHQTTELVSASDPALPCVTGDGPSALSTWSLSYDASRIAFWSEADDLVPNDTNGVRDVYVRDSQSGTNWLVSLNTNGVAADGLSTDPAISADGRFVAFTSVADDLVGGDTNRAQDVFVTSLPPGRPVLASINFSGTGPGNADSFSPILSSNGQFVLFHSRASNLTPGMPVVRTENLYWRDLQGGLTYALTTNKVTVASMTPDGGLVTYLTSSTLSAPSPDRLCVWDSRAKSSVYSLSGIGFLEVAISPDGGTIAYATNSATGWKQLWAVDRVQGTNTFVATVQSSSGLALRFSPDGQFLAYVAAVGAFSTTNQVYLYDFQTGTNLMVSRSYDGSSPGDDDSDSPDISADNRFVVYRSAADNLVPGDTNQQPDIFLYDRLSGTTTLVSKSRFGNGSADNRSLTPVFSSDGRTLAFISWASDLVPNDFNNNSDVFALPLYGGTSPSFLLSVSPLSPASLGNQLSWPVLPSKSYRVEFKESLIDPAWQQLNVPISVSGDQASATDATVPGTSRFYRVVAY